ncbi:MAG: hypothetical protein ACJAUL_001804 [Paraglaciecola sp.]|jgi:hypothetical protein
MPKKHLVLIALIMLFTVVMFFWILGQRNWLLHSSQFMCFEEKSI